MDKVERKESGAVCDKMIPIRLKSKFFKMVVMLAMMFVSKSWTVDKKLK